jgi:hypothetical protein
MSTETSTIYALAGEAYGAFERIQRGEETIVTLKDEHREREDWIYDLVWSAHGAGAMLPDDWRYETIRAALGFIHDNESDDAHEFADENVDVYTGSRLQWLASRLDRSEYVDQAWEEGLLASDATEIERIGVGQYMELLEVFESVRQSLEDRLEALEDAEEDAENPA